MKKTLKTLVRLERTRIDALRQQHNLLLDQRDHEQGEINGIAQSIDNEKAMAEQAAGSGDEHIGHFGAFGRRMRDQRILHEANLEYLAPKIEQSEIALIDAFADRKRYEIIDEQKTRRRLDQQNAKQQQEVDELTILRYRHRMDS